MNSEDGPLPRLPRELILEVFYSSSSFLDVLHFAATCRYIQAIWRDNVIPIYNHISWRAIPYRRYARELLACQIGTLQNMPVTVQDVVQLTRNSLVVEKSADRFSEKVMPVWRRGRKIFYGIPWFLVGRLTKIQESLTTAIYLLVENHLSYHHT